MPKGGFVFSISRCLGWTSKQPKNRIADGGASKEAIEYVKETGQGDIQDKPPAVVRISKEDNRKLDETIESHRPTKSNEAVKVKVSEEKGDILKITEADHVGKPVEDQKTKHVESAKVRKPHNVRRMESAGLIVGSILKTKTGRLKDYYNLGEKVGHGQYGTTFRCTEKATGTEYACKSIAKRKLETQEDIDDVVREIEILHHLSGHPNVISIKGSYEDATAVHIIMELCAGGELFDRIVKLGSYSERKAAELTRTIVGVVETCHSLGVMHRDLKPENFLFVNNDEDSPLKTIDFGLSVFFKPGEVLTDMVGSPYYVSPDVLGRSYGPEADIWSAGVITYILLCGTPPFWGETQEEIFKEILHGNIDFSSEPWPHISESAKDLVKKMIERDPKKRITAHDVLCHPWVQISGVAPDKPLDPVIFTRLKQFSAMDKLKKMALRVIAEHLSEEEVGGLREMFKMIDSDNSGQITRVELKAGLKRYGTSLADAELSDLMQAADVDNSGAIDCGEFIAATLHLHKIEKDELLLAAFSYFDKDGSGYITRDELQKASEEFGIDVSCLGEMMREVDQNNVSICLIFGGKGSYFSY
ncbi:hypothetical protein Leryth_027006 [Lithospermum erythrorhizon]|nr:hypothetical protein Leryth_027006 [Lithospermum erythrorhizon]